jgi:perosamine synthetase
LSRPIHHTFAPLADREQILTSLALAFQPWRWKEGPEKAELEEALGKAFGGNAHLFASGREALLASLKSLKFQKDEEVIVQGYTCVVVPNAIIAAGMVPIYADIESDTLNLDLKEVERLITPKTRAVICQHTFGIPSFTKQLRELCNRHSLILIEDCAHIMPDASGPAEVGRSGDLVFFSFGRDKAISGVGGGAVVCRNKDLCHDLVRLKEEALPQDILTIKRLLQYPIWYGMAKPFYGIGIGKAFLAGIAKLRMLVPIVTPKEKTGVMSPELRRMPNACAILALKQWKKLKTINHHRRMLTQLYFDEATVRGWPMLLGVKPGLPLQKFPLFTRNAEGIRKKLKARNIHLHDGWTGCVICPAAASCEAVGYKDGDDPKADMAGQQILTLPTHPDTTVAQAKKLIELLDPLLP